MPYEAHELFEAPADERAKIWRYMDFTKFVSLLDTKALFFARADKLAQLDPFEGRLTNADVTARAEFLKANYSDAPAEEWAQIGFKSEEELKTYQKILHRTDPTKFKYDSETIFINSWHIGEDESDAMWKLYVTGNNGIAVRSTYEGLKRALDKSAEKVMIGKIKYVDYNRHHIPKMDTFSPFLHKKSSYRHEAELRATVWKHEHLEYRYLDAQGRPASEAQWHSSYMATKYPELTGITVEVDLPSLVQEVYVSPKAEKWFYDLVQSVMKKYGCDSVVKQSDLYLIPRLN